MWHGGLDALLPERKEIHILQKFDVKTTGSLVASLTAFLTKTRSMLLTTPDHVEWIMQAIGHSFVLPMERYEDIVAAIDLYDRWLFTRDCPLPVQNDETKFFSRIFCHLSMLFDFGPDVVPNSSSSSSSTRRVQLCQRVLQIYQRLVREKNRLMNIPMWDVLLKVMLAISQDVLSRTEAGSTPANALETPLIHAMFDMWIRSRTRNPEHWRLLASFSRKWTHRQKFIDAWAVACTAITNHLVRVLYGVPFGNDSVFINWTRAKDLVSSGARKEDFRTVVTMDTSREVLYFWHQMLRVLSFHHIREPAIYGVATQGVSRMVDSFLRVADQESEQGVTVRAPDGNSILDVFAPWVFEPSRGPLFEQSRAVRCGTLCRIFCQKSRTEFRDQYLSMFYDALIAALTANPPNRDVVVRVIENGSTLLSCGLKGSRCLIPSLMPHLRHILSDQHYSVVTRRCAIMMIGSILPLDMHFFRKFETLKASLPPQSHISKMRHHLLSLPNLLIKALISETDSHNQEMILWSMCVFLKIDTSNLETGTQSSFPGIVISTLWGEISSQQNQWSFKVYMTAFEVLSSAAQFQRFFNESNFLVSKRLVPDLCRYINSRLSGIKSLADGHPDLVEQNTALALKALGCLEKWLITVPWIMSQHECAREVIKCVVSGIDFAVDKQVGPERAFCVVFNRECLKLADLLFNDIGGVSHSPPTFDHPSASKGAPLNGGRHRLNPHIHEADVLRHISRTYNVVFHQRHYSSADAEAAAAAEVSPKRPRHLFGPSKLGNSTVNLKVFLSADPPPAAPASSNKPAKLDVAKDSYKALTPTSSPILEAADAPESDLPKTLDLSKLDLNPSSSSSSAAANGATKSPKRPAHSRSQTSPRSPTRNVSHNKTANSKTSRSPGSPTSPYDTVSFSESTRPSQSSNSSSLASRRPNVSIKIETSASSSSDNISSTPTSPSVRELTAKFAHPLQSGTHAAASAAEGSSKFATARRSAAIKPPSRKRKSTPKHVKSASASPTNANLPSVFRASSMSPTSSIRDSDPPPPSINAPRPPADSVSSGESEGRSSNLPSSRTLSTLKKSHSHSHSHPLRNAVRPPLASVRLKSGARTMPRARASKPPAVSPQKPKQKQRSTSSGGGKGGGDSAAAGGFMLPTREQYLRNAPPSCVRYFLFNKTTILTFVQLPEETGFVTIVRNAHGKYAWLSRQTFEELSAIRPMAGSIKVVPNDERPDTPHLLGQPSEDRLCGALEASEGLLRQAEEKGAAEETAAAGVKADAGGSGGSAGAQKAAAAAAKQHPNHERMTHKARSSLRLAHGWTREAHTRAEIADISAAIQSSSRPHTTSDVVHQYSSDSSPSPDDLSSQNGSSHSSGENPRSGGARTAADRKLTNPRPRLNIPVDAKAAADGKLALKKLPKVSEQSEVLPPLSPSSPPPSIAPSPPPVMLVRPGDARSTKFNSKRLGASGSIRASASPGHKNTRSAPALDVPPSTSSSGSRIHDFSQDTMPSALRSKAVVSLNANVNAVKLSSPPSNSSRMPSTRPKSKSVQSPRSSASSTPSRGSRNLASPSNTSSSGMMTAFFRSSSPPPPSNGKHAVSGGRSGGGVGGSMCDVPKRPNQEACNCDFQDARRFLANVGIIAPFPDRLAHFQALKATSKLSAMIDCLDKMSPRTQIPISVVYRKPTQFSELEALKNSSTSAEFLEFVQDLGTMVDLSTHQDFAGEVDASEVDHLPYFSMPEVEMLFQVMPLMQRCDRQRLNELHLNVPVRIVWSENPTEFSIEPHCTRDGRTLPAVYILIVPLGAGLYRIGIDLRSYHRHLRKVSYISNADKVSQQFQNYPKSPKSLKFLQNPNHRFFAGGGSGSGADEVAAAGTAQLAHGHGHGKSPLPPGADGHGKQTTTVSTEGHVATVSINATSALLVAKGGDEAAATKEAGEDGGHDDGRKHRVESDLIGPLLNEMVVSRHQLCALVRETAVNLWKRCTTEVTTKDSRIDVIRDIASQFSIKAVPDSVLLASMFTNSSVSSLVASSRGGTRHHREKSS